jgi:hypothetical protein
MLDRREAEDRARSPVAVEADTLEEELSGQVARAYRREDAFGAAILGPFD